MNQQPPMDQAVTNSEKALGEVGWVFALGELAADSMADDGR